MLDQYSRNIDYIRISVTDRCNLRCIYCMPQTSKTYLRQEELLTYDEIVKLAGIYRSLGIKNVKLTGGEPLVREHVDELIFRLKEECGMEKVTLTTNGILLGQQLEGIVKARLDGVNISLDTLKSIIIASQEAVMRERNLLTAIWKLCCGACEKRKNRRESL